VPATIDPLACTPPSPPEQPQVVVRVDRAGRAPGSVAVRLKYDAGRQAYVYTLPPVTWEKVGDRAAGISLHASLQFDSPTRMPPPTYAFIPFPSYCLTTP
jgi:hypothetical protein